MFFQRRFYILLIFACLFLLLFVLYVKNLISNSKNINDLEDIPIINYHSSTINRYNLNSSLGSNEFFNTEIPDIIGEWYLQGYRNVKISFYPVKNQLHSNELKISSTNIGLYTLEEFSSNDYMSGISNLDFNSLKEFYSLDLVGGKLGTLFLRKDQNLKIFKRAISPDAIEGEVPPNCACSGTCQD